MQVSYRVLTRFFEEVTQYLVEYWLSDDFYHVESKNSDSLC